MKRRAHDALPPCPHSKRDKSRCEVRTLTSPSCVRCAEKSSPCSFASASQPGAGPSYINGGGGSSSSGAGTPPGGGGGERVRPPPLPCRALVAGRRRAEICADDDDVPPPCAFSPTLLPPLPSPPLPHTRRRGAQPVREHAADAHAAPGGQQQLAAQPENVLGHRALPDGLGGVGTCQTSPPSTSPRPWLAIVVPYPVRFGFPLSLRSPDTPASDMFAERAACRIRPTNARPPRGLIRVRRLLCIVPCLYP